MRHHDALRHAAGAGGVDEAGGVVARHVPDDVGDVVRLRLAERQDLVPVMDLGMRELPRCQRLDGDDVRDVGDLVGRRHDALGQRRRRDDDRTGAAVREDVAMVLDGVGRVGGNGDGAGGHDGEIGDQPFRPVLGDEGDAVAAPDPERAQAARQRAHLTRRLAPGERPVASRALGPEEGLVALPRRLVEQHRRQAGTGLEIHGASRLSVSCRVLDVLAPQASRRFVASMK